jgi:hypothetical protein
MELGQLRKSYYLVGVFPRVGGFGRGVGFCTVVLVWGVVDRGPRVKKGENGPKVNTLV